MGSQQTDGTSKNNIQAEETIKNKASNIMEEQNNIEYEPFDTEKEKYYQQDLMDKYDYHMVTTTRLRKTGPVRVKSKFKELCRLKLRHVYTAHFESANSEENLKEMLVEEDSCLDQSAIEERLKDSNDKFEEIKTSCAQILSNTGEIVKSVEMHKRFSNSDIDKVLYETPPTKLDLLDTGSCCFSETHLNKFINEKLHV